MKNKTKFGKSILLASIAAVSFGAVAAGTTYALFTSKTENNVTVTTGKVSISTSVDNIKLYSLSGTTGEVEEIESTTTFTNGGSFAYDSETGAITLEKFTPGDKVEFSIKAINESNVNIKVRNVIKTSYDNGLFDGLIVKIDGAVYDGVTTFGEYSNVAKDAELDKSEYKISIELPVDSGNEYQGKKCELSFNLEALQGNAKVETKDATIYSIYTPTDLAVFAKKVNNGALTETKVVLENTIDMNGVNYTSPIYDTNTVYKHDLEFDGQGYSIDNFAPIENDNVTGLFGGVFAGGASVNIHDITFVAPVVKGSDNTTSGNRASGVVLGSGDSANVTISDITISNATVSNTKWGGIVTGYTSGDTTIKKY